MCNVKGDFPVDLLESYKAVLKLYGRLLTGLACSPLIHNVLCVHEKHTRTNSIKGTAAGIEVIEIGKDKRTFLFGRFLVF